MDTCTDIYIYIVYIYIYILETGISRSPLVQFHNKRSCSNSCITSGCCENYDDAFPASQTSYCRIKSHDNEHLVGFYKKCPRCVGTLAGKPCWGHFFFVCKVSLFCCGCKAWTLRHRFVFARSKLLAPRDAIRW